MLEVSMEETKMYNLLYLIALIFSFSGFVSAHACDGSQLSPCIVVDNNSPNAPIKSYRSALILKEQPDIHPLRASGSESPTQFGWEEIVTKIQSQNTPIKQVWVLDLRQESHLYVNGVNITHASKYNWINAGLSKNAILDKEDAWMKSLSQSSTLENAMDSQQFQEEQYDKGVEIPIQTIQLEETLVQSLSLKYERMPIQDHCRPDDEVVDALIDFFANIRPDDWVHLHCRGGKGRTTTVLAMYDMLLNANQLSFDDIITRQKSIPPYYDLEFTNKGIPELTPYYKERLAFLHQFYLYTQDRLAGYPGKWTDWLAIENKRPD